MTDTTTALDLATDVPRSPFAEIDGYAWLPRMIDKARATFAGTVGDYTPYPCPLDRVFLRYFKLDADALGEVIRSGASEAAIAEWVTAHSPRDEAAKAAFARGQSEPERTLIMRLAIMVYRRKRRALLAERFPNRRLSEIHSFARMLALDEGHPVPGF